MKFVFELYRASSKSKNIPKAKKLILNSNDNMHPQQKAKFVGKLRALAHAQAISQVVGDTKIVKQVSGRKGKGKTSYLTQFVTPQYDKHKPCGVVLTMFPPTNRRSDPDNLQPTLKAFMDGLTDANFWPDDNHEIVKFTKYQYGGLSGSKGYRLEIEISEVFDGSN